MDALPAVDHVPCGSFVEHPAIARYGDGLAALSTASRSAPFTSLSRSTPCREVRSRMCEPGDAGVDRAGSRSQWPIGSTARWIDCTVDSISTTTPRLRPKESPRRSPPPLLPYSPTMATVLRCRDVEADDQRFFAFAGSWLWASPVGAAAGRRAGTGMRSSRPARLGPISRREAVAVAQVGTEKAAGGLAAVRGDTRREKRFQPGGAHRRRHRGQAGRRCPDRGPRAAPRQVDAGPASWLPRSRRCTSA